MGRMAYALRLVAGLMMVAAVVLAFIVFHDVMDNLGNPGGDHILGALMLVAFGGFLIVFLSGAILWVLTDISEQLGLSHKLSEPADQLSSGQKLEARNKGDVPLSGSEMLKRVHLLLAL